MNDKEKANEYQVSNEIWLGQLRKMNPTLSINPAKSFGQIVYDEGHFKVIQAVVENTECEIIESKLL